MIRNFYPIIFDFDNYQVVRTEGDAEVLQELRSKHNSTHSFFKQGGDIYISNKQGEDLGIGETVTMSVYGDKEITTSLIRHIYFKTFLETYKNYKPNGFYPFVIQSLKPENDLIRKFLPKGLQDRIAYIKQIELQLRTLLIDEKETFGFLINIRRTWKINISCKELVQRGFDIIDLEVVHSISIPGLQSVLLPDETLIGNVKVVEGKNALISTNEGDHQYKLEELYLRKTQRNIRNLLAFGLKDSGKAENILEHVKDEEHRVLNPQNIITEIQNAATVLFHDKEKNPLLYKNKDGFCFHVDTSPKLPFRSYQLEKPIFVFDPSRVRTNTFSDAGLVKYGPYDSSHFTPKEPRILFVCNREIRGKASTFLKELIDGIPNSKYFTKGFKAKYELHNVHFDIQEIISNDISSITAATSKLHQIPDIVIIGIPSSLKEVRQVENSLYYHLKAHFLGLQIPIQIVSTEIIGKYDEYKLNAIALQMYAKLGGVPWTIQTKESVDREIIIGIGNSIFRNNAFSGNEQERIVGISTFFSGDGQYMMSGNIKDIPYQEYFQALLDSLRESIKALANEYAWRQNDTVRLIFHIFKPIKNVEYEVVRDLVKEFSEYRIQFAFVTLSEFHPFIMFDENQPGINRFGKVIGKYVPKRGSNIVLDETSCLVQMLGPDEMKTDRQGSSSPLLVRIIRPHSYTVDEQTKAYLFFDLHYIVQQIFKFSYLSWRSFLPNQRPATMLYSTLIARLLGRLRRIPGWKSEVINLNLKFKKWFL